MVLGKDGEVLATFICELENDECAELSEWGHIGGKELDVTWFRKNIPCRKSTIQNYQCEAIIMNPFTNKMNSIDVCMIKEIMYLWDNGIQTTGCCCGKHLNLPDNSSFIGVTFDCIDKMKELGYEVRFNECRPDDEDSFVPKGIR